MMRVTNRWMQTAAALVLLGVAARAGAAEERTLPFPGGVKLEIETDAMTDKTKCRVFTDPSAAYVGVYGANDVVVWVDSGTHVSRQAPALLRIGKAKPIRLTIASRPNMLLVPKAAATGVLKGLYARETVALRFSDRPYGNPIDVEVQVGDFGAAYEAARRECKWKAVPGAVRTTMPIAPHIYKGQDEAVMADFPGPSSRGPWSITSMPKYGVCSIRTSEASSVVSYRERKPETVISPFTATFLDADRSEVGRVTAVASQVHPFQEFFELAERAGPMGSVKFAYGETSLFGFVEAVEFAEKTCGITLVKRTPPPVADAPAAAEAPAPTPPRTPVVTGAAAE